MLEIRLFKGDDVWMAQCDEHLTLFETDTLPTPFFINMPPKEVLQRISELNPKAKVSIIYEIYP